MLNKLITYCLVGVIIWCFASMVLAIGIALSFIPFLFFDLFAAAFICAYITVEFCFTLLFICAMIITVTSDKEDKEE